MTILLISFYSYTFSIGQNQPNASRRRGRRNYLDANYKREFEKVLETWCDPMNLNISDALLCLNRIRQFDQNFPLGKRTDCARDEVVDFHVFWQFDEGEILLRTLKLNVMSFLVTQNLNCSKLVLWTLSNFPHAILSEIMHDFVYYVKNNNIEMRTFDLDELCSEASRIGAHFANAHICTSKIIRRIRFMRSQVGYSDFVRFILLDIYGGKEIKDTFQRESN